ncbi:MAG TPA: hypothetical protein VFZ53_02685 [Polyangiaceae bacterium]
MAIEVSSGRLVVVAICESARLASLSAARGLTHRHLLTIIDIVKDIPRGAFPERVQVPAGAVAVVAEHVPGVTLKKSLDDGPIHAAKAVAWVLRLADAVQALHAVGAVHGAISPRSILAGAEGRPIAPVLSQLMVPPIGAFCPPERLRGGPETPADDVWALYATLYASITGKAPFSGSTREALLRAMNSRPAPLSTFGVEEPALQEIIARGLSAERRFRAVELADLVAILDGWERDPKMLPLPAPPQRAAPSGLGNIVSGAAFGSGRDDGVVIDDAELPDDQGRSADVPDDELATVIAKPGLDMLLSLSSAAAARPPMTPGGSARQLSAPVAPKRPSINPFARKGSVVPWLAVAAIGVGALGYFLLGSGDTAQTQPAATVGDAPPLPRPIAKPAAQKAPEARRDECVLDHFAADSFDGRPDFAFVCRDGDLRATAAQLHGMVKEHVVDAGAEAGVPDAGSELALDVRARRSVDGGTAGTRLGWYELPTTAIIRKTCCPQAAPVVLPETPGRCEQLQKLVRALADDSAKSVDLAPTARSFDKAVGCLYAQRIRHGYGYERPPIPANRAHFQQFLSRAAIISAKR